MTITSERACELLEIPTESDRTACQAAFLRCLKRDEFSPPELILSAANRLSLAEFPLTEDAQSQIASQFRSDVDYFAENYWKVSPEERRVRWESLNAQCELPGDREFLTHLQHGLNLPCEHSSDSSGAEEIINGIREMYILRPRQRRERRYKLLDELQKNALHRPKEYLPNMLEKIYEIEATYSILDPKVVQAMMTLHEPVFITSRPKPVEPTNTHERESSYRRQLEYDPAPSNEKSIFSFWWVVIPVMIVIRLALSGNSSSNQINTDRFNSTPPVNYQSSNYQASKLNYTLPTYPRAKPPNIGTTLVGYTDDQWIKMLEHDPKAGRPSPPGYVMLRLSGVKDDNLTEIRKAMKLLTYEQKLEIVKNLREKLKADNPEQ